MEGGRVGGWQGGSLVRSLAHSLLLPKTLTHSLTDQHHCFGTARVSRKRLAPLPGGGVRYPTPPSSAPTRAFPATPAALALKRE